MFRTWVLYLNLNLWTIQGGINQLPSQRHTYLAYVVSSPLRVEKKVKVKSLSHVWLLVTPWTVAHHSPPSMGFSRKEYWSGFPCPSSGDLPDPGIEPGWWQNLDSMLKSRDITLLTKVQVVKAMVFPVVTYGCESWTVKKPESQRIDAFNNGAGEDSWESLGQ